MLKTHRRRLTGRQGAFSAGGLLLAGLLLVHAGCGRSGKPPAEATQGNPAPSPIAAGEAAAKPSPTPTPAIPAPDVPGDAPVLRDVYPTLASGALRLARLTALPGNVLLQAEGVSVTEGDLQNALDQAPPDMQEELRKNAFFLLEQESTLALLTALAQRRIGNTSLPRDRLLQRYFEVVTRDVSVSDTEIESFYKDNRELVGDAPLEEAKPRIREHLRQQKQQEAVEEHVAALGSEMTIALDGEWVKEQAAPAMDNPVDKARASGKPTFVNFGAKGCVPCDMMEPVREEIGRAYAGRLNVVFVHVNQDRILASRYGIRGIPHLVFFDKDGKEVHAHTGFMPREQIEEWVKKSGVSDS